MALARAETSVGSRRIPAEWAPHRACWVAWPAAADLWKENLAQAQTEFTAMCRAIGDGSRGPAERLEVLVATPQAQQEAEAALAGIAAAFHSIPYGDIWLRDTGPIFGVGPAGRPLAHLFSFNGWGEKYELPHDREVSRRVARASRAEAIEFPFILEGGAVEMDGEGTLLTTRQCLLNPNRNPGRSEREVESALREALGVRAVRWLDQGLKNDHTDGHIDTLARFIGPAKVACMVPKKGDPNAAVLRRIRDDLNRMEDAGGRKLTVVEVPSPGLVEGEQGEPMPASYLNFYIGNRTVVVPVYGSASDGEAARVIAGCFPDRRTVALPAKAILTGGGAFHCITQQEPAV